MAHEVDLVEKETQEAKSDTDVDTEVDAEMDAELQHRGCGEVLES